MKPRLSNHWKNAPQNFQSLETLPVATASGGPRTPLRGGTLCTNNTKTVATERDGHLAEAPRALGGPRTPLRGQHTKHPGKLYHKTPGWVPDGARFHIRIRMAPHSDLLLTDPVIAPSLLDSVAFYHTAERWYVWLVLFMPDHLHAILSFPRAVSMSRVIGEWKKYHAKTLRLNWQENYFDHRLRNDDEFVEKAHYIRMNPVRAGLCPTLEAWPWIAEPWRNDADGGPRTPLRGQESAVATERDGHP